jgi:hypothetical protein
MAGSRWKNNSPLERLEQRVSFDDDGCWRWTGHVQTRGYGQMQVNHRMIVVHKLAWTLFRDEVPEGMDVHHRCEEKRCVNPDHLELVEHTKHKAAHHRKTHCKRGHAFTAENSYVSGTGAKRCRTCIQASRDRWLARQKARI